MGWCHQSYRIQAGCLILSLLTSSFRLGSPCLSRTCSIKRTLLVVVMVMLSSSPPISNLHTHTHNPMDILHTRTPNPIDIRHTPEENVYCIFCYSDYYHQMGSLHVPQSNYHSKHFWFILILYRHPQFCNLGIRLVV